MPWIAAVWHKLTIPKCSFTSWLAFKNRLLTKDRMMRFGMQTDLRCVLCNNAIETNAHLFSSCNFIATITTSSGFYLTENWSSYLNGNFTIGIRGNIRKWLAFLFLNITIYFVWQERNERIHNPGQSRTALQIKAIVLRMLREKVFSSNLFQKAVQKDHSLTLLLY